MARAFYPYETNDPDLDWLITNFLYDRPDFNAVESGVLPIVLIRQEEVFCPCSLIEDESALEEDTQLPDHRVKVSEQ